MKKPKTNQTGTEPKNERIVRLRYLEGKDSPNMYRYEEITSDGASFGPENRGQAVIRQLYISKSAMTPGPATILKVRITW